MQRTKLKEAVPKLFAEVSVDGVVDNTWSCGWSLNNIRLPRSTTQHLVHFRREAKSSLCFLHVSQCFTIKNLQGVAKKTQQRVHASQYRQQYLLAR
jgi:hypothetical protein